MYIYNNIPTTYTDQLKINKIYKTFGQAREMINKLIPTKPSLVDDKTV